MDSAVAPESSSASAGPASKDGSPAIPAVVGCISSMVDRGGSAESNRLFLARRTALEMLRDRSYGVPDAELARTIPEFRAWWAEKPNLDRLSFSTTLASDLSKKVQIIFCPPEPVKIATIREIYGRSKREHLSRLILILQSKITSKAKDSIKEIFSFKVEIFQLPCILETDAIACYHGLDKGTVIKVTYNSELKGDHVTYRCIL